MIYEDYDTHGQSTFYFYKIYFSTGNLKCKNGYKPNSQGYGKSKTATWLFQAPWQTSFLFDGIKHSLAAGLMPSQWKMFMFHLISILILLSTSEIVPCYYITKNLIKLLKGHSNFVSNACISSQASDKD